MDASVAIGDILAGKYAVERILASGGSGVVVLARHLQLLEPCAVKLLRREGLSTPQAEERFLREARAVARLKSDHVVRVFDVGQLDDGTPYMVMERLEGIDLEETLQRRGALPVGEAALYALQICAALAEAHRRGIVHRDLKPANVFVTRTEDGEPRLKLLDFGIAKMLGAPDGVDPMTTLEGTIMGTPLFMAPEQIAGGPVDPRTDVWALGVLLYHLLTGHLPFTAATAATSLAKILAHPPVPPSAHQPSIPTDLERIVLRCLEKRAGARPASVGEIADAIAPFAGAAGGPLSRRVRRVLDGATDPGPAPAPAQQGTSIAPTLAAARPVAMGGDPPNPPAQPVPHSVSTAAVTGPRREASWGMGLLAATTIALAAAAGFALARPATPRVSAGAQPPHPRSSESAVRAAPAPPDTAATATPQGTPVATSSPARPAAPATATSAVAPPAPSARRPPLAPSAGFDWGDRH